MGVSALLFTVFFALSAWAVAPGFMRTETASASAPLHFNQLYNVRNVTQDADFGVGYINNFARNSLFTPAAAAAAGTEPGRIVVMEQAVMGDFIPLHNGAANIRRVVWVEPDDEGVLRVIRNGTPISSWAYRDPEMMWGLTAAQLEAEGMTRTGSSYFSSMAVNNGNNVLAIQIPAGGFLMVAHGSTTVEGTAAYTLTNRFAVGDEVEFTNRSPFRLLNETRKWGMRHEIPIRAKNTTLNIVAPYGDTIMYTARETRSITRSGWRGYIRAAWDDAANGYVVNLVGTSNFSAGVVQPADTPDGPGTGGIGPIEVPRNGFVIEGHAFGGGGHWAGASYALSNIFNLTAVGDVLTFEDSILSQSLPASTDVFESGGVAFEMDGINPTEAAAVAGKSVIYTSPFAHGTTTFHRYKDAEYVEYALTREGCFYYEVTAINTDTATAGTVIPTNGLVISVPSTVADYDEWQVGDTVVRSGVAHNWEEWVEVAATCQAAGSRTRSCANCEDIETDAEFAVSNPIDPDAHSMGEWETTLPPTCSAAGNERRICTNGNCGHLENRELGINPDAHSWGGWSTTTPPTCTEAGERTRVCVYNPEHTQTEMIDQLGHSWGGWTTDMPATCMAAGSRSRTCATCQAPDTETIPINATAHSWGNWVEVAASCVAAGSRTRTCTGCGDMDIDAAFVTANPPVGHSWGDWVEVHATCVAGSRTRVCSVCQSVDTDSAFAVANPPVGCTWGEWTVITPATADAEGLRRRVCEHDPTHIQEEAIPRLQGGGDTGCGNSSAAAALTVILLLGLALSGLKKRG